MADTPTFGRFPEISYERMTLEQRESLRFVLEKRGRLPGPTKIYVHNPNLAKAIAPFGAHLRKTLSLRLREREIVVCIVTDHWHCAYATQVHERDAKADGLPPEQIEAIKIGRVQPLVGRQQELERLSALQREVLAVGQQVYFCPLMKRRLLPERRAYSVLRILSRCIRPQAPQAVFLSAGQV